MKCASCMGGTSPYPTDPELVPMGPGRSMVRCRPCKGRGSVSAPSAPV